jgi:hypothetical protein
MESYNRLAILTISIVILVINISFLIHNISKQNQKTIYKSRNNSTCDKIQNITKPAFIFEPDSKPPPELISHRFKINYVLPAMYRAEFRPNPRYNITDETFNFIKDKYSIFNTQEVINPHNYDFILNPKHKICGYEDDLLLIALVPSEPHRFMQRNLVRTTWANQKLYGQKMRHIFLIGKSQDPIVNKNLEFEFNLHGDFAQEDFLDTYHNLTIKTIMMFKFVASYCSNAKFALKIDDDVVVNPVYLLNFLHYLATAKEYEFLNNAFLCRYYTNSKAIRFTNTKFYVSKEEYTPAVFPPYCDGPSYMFTTDLAGLYYYHSKYVKTFKFEDVYLAFLAMRLMSTYLDLDKFYYYDRVWQRNLNVDLKYFMIAYEPVNYGQMWNFVNNKTKELLKF